LLGGLLGGLRRRQSSEGENGGLDGILSGLGGLKKRQDTAATLRSAVTSITDDGPISANQRRQSSVSDSDNGNNDDSLLDLLDGSDLKVDGNGQDINVADLRRRQLPSLTNNGDANGNNDDTLLNAVDGSRAGVNQNAQNISIAKYRRKRQLLNDLGGESESVSNSGNGDNDESLLNVLDGSTAQVDHNVGNLTVLRRYRLQHQSRHDSVSLVAKARRWLSTLFDRAAPTKTTTDSGNANDDDAVVNALDGSAAAVDGNGQDVTVLRRRQASTPTPSASAVPIASAAPIAPAQDPPAAPVSDGDKTNTNTDDNNHSDDDALVNAGDDSGADVSKNLQNVTILRHRRGSVSNNNDGDSNANDDETLANALDVSSLKADDNAQGVDVAPL
ncbi:hypothetical protein F66182_15481, partial [Fusarium sp. NRRL 66182]